MTLVHSLTVKNSGISSSVYYAFYDIVGTITEFIQETVDETSKGNARKFKAKLFLAIFNDFYVSAVEQFT